VADGVLSRKTFLWVAVGRAATCLIVLFSICLTSHAYAQVGEVIIDDETFRKTANGRRLADIAVGTTVLVTRTEGSWTAVDMEGWVLSDALGVTAREGHNGIVTQVNGTNLRREPSGTILAHLLEGFLLHRREDRDGWTRIKRSGWVRSMSLTTPAAILEQDRFSIDQPPEILYEGRRLVTDDAPLEMHDAPEGDPMATVLPGKLITVVERKDQWARIRIEGWVPAKELAISTSDSTLVDVSAAVLKANPDEYQNMRVHWTLQFVALEMAEPERTDFYEGEPFILARTDDPSDGLVYIAVPPELLGTIQAIRPLQNIEILAQVRTGRSSLMGVPVLDLLALF